MKLPDEILLMVMEALEFPSLYEVSIVNKLFNQLSNPRLWRHFSMHDVHPAQAQTHWFCVSRNPSRSPARSVYQITVHSFSPGALSTEFSNDIRYYCPYLHSTLVLVISQEKENLTGISQAPMTFSPSSNYSPTTPLNFRSILELRMIQPPRLILRAFLKYQDSIECLRVSQGTDWKNDIDVLDLSGLLPRMRWQIVPLSFVKEFIRGRHLQALEIDDPVTGPARRLNSSSSIESDKSLYIAAGIVG